MTRNEFIDKWADILYMNGDTNSSKEIIKDLDALIDNLCPQEPTQDKISEYVGAWIALWPTPSQMVSYGFPDKKALVDDDEVGKKMKAFLKKMGRDSFENKTNIITLATKEYIKGIRDANKWQYIKKAHYFIEKRGEGSELTAFIKVIKTRPITQENKTSQDYKFG
jgi:hypothetical protein